MSWEKRIVIVGGGAAGFFAAVTCAEAAPEKEIWLLEKGPQFLTKVRISGGGRCNVTHACFDPRALSSSYPRGERPLIAPFHRFQPNDTVEWFARRGVRLKIEPDGRMFPTTDSSQTIIDCLLREAQRLGVKMWTRRGVERASRREGGGFTLQLSDTCAVDCAALLLATGGARTPAAGALAESLGHSLVPPVPSLFTFHIDVPWLRELPGLTVEDAEVSVPETALRERGPILITHWGLSGPAILRLSAWGARVLHDRNYHFTLHVNWLPSLNPEQITEKLRSLRTTDPAKLVSNTPLSPLPSRLWTQLAAASGVSPETRWTTLPRPVALTLAKILHRTEFPVQGKSLNKDEFVTCGGVSLREVDFKTMQSRLCPGLYFAGELLDIDGITGGFNFQAAWTTAWLAANSLGSSSSLEGA